MTITSRVNRATMDGNGVSTTLAIDFPFHSVEDLIVIETIIATGAETTKVLNTDYTVGGAQDDAGHFPDGGEITFTTPPASSVRVVAYRDPPMLQGVVLQETGKIPVKAAIESPLDKLTMVDQRLSERVDRTLRVSDGDSTPLGRLPAKTVRASRYLGFDGDGNPTMMQTPTAMVTSLAQLAESTVAALPAAGAAGTLRKVTDNVRGVWMDTGTRWTPVNGAVANIQDFGAVGDGETDDTSAIQAALDAGDHVVIPHGTYRITATLLIRRHRQSLSGYGRGSIIACTATSGLFCAIGVVELITDTVLRNFVLLGNASSEPAGPAPLRGLVLGTNTLGTAHSVLSWDARSLVENVYISGITPGVTGFNLGVQINHANKSLIKHSTIDSLYGTAPNYGYGIVCDSNDTDVIDLRCYATIAGQGRHAIYFTGSPNRCRAIDCYVEGFQNEAFTTNPSSGGESIEFINCTAKDCLATAVGATAAVFAFHGGRLGRMSGCRALGSVRSSNVFGITVQDCPYTSVSGCYVERVDQHGVYVGNSSYTRVNDLIVNGVGVENPAVYGGITIVTSDYVVVDGLTLVGPARFIARLDSTAPTPVHCRISNLLYSGSVTFEIENYDLNPGSNLVSTMQLPTIPRANLPAAGIPQHGTLVIDDNGAGDRNLVLYAYGERFRIDGGLNI